MQGAVARWLVLTLCAVCAHAQYNGNLEMRKRMKLLSGGTPPVTSPRPPEARNASPFADIVYTEPVLEGPYLAEPSWNPRGMGQLYTVTSYFLRLILHKDAYPESLFYTQNQNLRVGDPEEHWEEWLQFYAGPLAVIGVGLLFCILIPLAGLIFCCCRLAGRCGARSRLEKRHDPCKRGFIATLLLIVAVIILFGVVCAFVTNEQMKEGTETLVDSAKTSLKDTQLYLKNTKTEVDNLLIANFKQLEERLNLLMKDAGEIVKDQLANASHAVVLSNLTTIAAGLEVIKTDLEDIDRTTREVQRTAADLGEALDQTRDELLRELKSCRDESACRELMQLPQIRDLRVIQNFSQLPDLSRTFASIRNLVGNGSTDSIQNQVMEGQRSLDNIKLEVMNSVQFSMPLVSASLQNTGVKLEEAADRIKYSINEMSNLLNWLAGRSLDQADHYIDEYAIFRYYLGLGMSCVLLLILLCITLGLMCGICGKRPEDLYNEDADWCSTVAGSRFLMMGVGLMFLLAGGVMVLTIVHFLFGTAATVLICRPLADPRQDQVFRLMDRYVDLDSIYQGKHVDMTISELIATCHQNKSMYTTLKLENVINIDEVLDYNSMREIDQQMKQFVARISVTTDRVQLLSPAARRRLVELSQSPLNDIQFNRYTELLSGAVANVNLPELVAKLREHADQIPQYGNYDTAYIRRLLRTKAKFLELLQTDHVVKVHEGVALIKSNVSNLRQHLKFNNTSLRAAVESLLLELDVAQRFLINNGTTHMRLLVSDFSREYLDFVQEYLQRVVAKTKADIGRCGVVSRVYNATQVAGCSRLVDPLNGFWASVGWCLLLFIPALFLAIKLSSLYQNSDAYTAAGIYPESEYLYDAYADRDNIPLAVTNGDKKQNRSRNFQESYDNSSGNAFMQDYSAHLGRTERTSSAGQGRFADMANKNWESRGPPRYQQPPGPEYERPPPYYYPGPGERA